MAPTTTIPRPRVKAKFELLSHHPFNGAPRPGCDMAEISGNCWPAEVENAIGDRELKLVVELYSAAVGEDDSELVRHVESLS